MRDSKALEGFHDVSSYKIKLEEDTRKWLGDILVGEESWQSIGVVRRVSQCKVVLIEMIMVA